jgi:hypothetical protein
MLFGILFILVGVVYWGYSIKNNPHSKFKLNRLNITGDICIGIGLALLTLF